MDSWEWTLWKTLLGIDPYGEDREDWRAAQLEATFANFAGKVSTRRVEVKDCLLKFKTQEAKPTRQALEDKIRIGFAGLMALQRVGQKPQEN